MPLVASREPKGFVEVRTEECKGCGICISVCPPKCLQFDKGLSTYGVHPARYTGEGCTGCGICFYCCPEPGGITVFRAATERARRKSSEEPAYAAL